MSSWNRRQFLARSGVGLGAGLAAAPTAAGQSAIPIDFRYAPLSGQTAFCFPDDPSKSLVGERGELRYGFARGRFETVVGFSVTGVEPDVVARQELEAPSVPIVHTRIDRAEAFLYLIAFATNRASEGRVDNVIVEIGPRTRRTVRAAPVVTVRSRRAVRSQGNAVYLDGDGGRLLFASDQPRLGPSDTGGGWGLRGKLGAAPAGGPLPPVFPLSAGRAASRKDRRRARGARRAARRSQGVLACVAALRRARVMACAGQLWRVSDGVRAQHTASPREEEWPADIPGWAHGLPRPLGCGRQLHPEIGRA